MLRLLRELLQKLWPYLVVGILVPGGSVLVLTHLLYRRRPSSLAVPTALASSVSPVAVFLPSQLASRLARGRRSVTSTTTSSGSYHDLDRLALVHRAVSVGRHRRRAVRGLYDESGQPLSGTFADYMMPTAREVPRVEVLITEDAASPLNPLGVKGAGEAGVNAVGAAIASAIDDALGEQVYVTRSP